MSVWIQALALTGVLLLAGDACSRGPANAGPAAAAAVAGFAFGSTVEEARAKCTSAGYDWTTKPNGFYGIPDGICSGLPEGIGHPGRAAVAFCDGHLCGVRLEIKPDGKCPEYEAAFQEYRAVLTRKYGGEESIMRFDCAKAGALGLGAPADAIPQPSVARWHAGETQIALVFGNLNGLWITLLLEYQAKPLQRLLERTNGQVTPEHL